LVYDAGAQQAIYTLDAKYMLLRGVDGTASIKRALTGEPVGMPFEPSGSVRGFAISPDESEFMTGAANGDVQFWDAGTGLPRGETFRHSGGAWAVAISPDGTQAVSGGLNGDVELWDARMGSRVRELVKLEKAPIRGLAYSPDGSRIAVASSDKLAWIVGTDVGAGARKLKLKGHRGSVMTVAFSPDGKQVATGSFDNTVIVWDAQTGRALTKPMRHGGPFWYAVAFSGDGQTVVAGCEDHTVRIWDVATARPIGPMLRHDAALRAAAFTKNDSQIITGTSAGTTYIWDVSRPPLKADVEWIALWLQVSTGMELGDDGEVRPLSPETWQQRRKALYELGGTPIAH
jgi:WD40 repeat protein